MTLLQGRVDATAGIDRGLLKEVTEGEGTGLVGDHAAGATVLQVASSSFRAEGTCRVAGVEYAYVRAADSDSLTIAPGLDADAEDGEPVESLTPAGVVESGLVAVIDLDCDGDSNDVRAAIPGELAGFYRSGTVDAGAIVSVRDVPYGYEVVGRPLDAPKLDPAVIATPYMRAYLAADVSIPDATLTPITGWTVAGQLAFGPWSPDVDGWFRFDQDGVYMVVVTSAWQPNGTGARYVQVQTRHLDGSVHTVKQIAVGTVAGATISVQATAVLGSSEGLWVRGVVQQNSGAALNLAGTADGRLTGIEIVKVAEQ